MKVAVAILASESPACAPEIDPSTGFEKVTGTSTNALNDAAAIGVPAELVTILAVSVEVSAVTIVAGLAACEKLRRGSVVSTTVPLLATVSQPAPTGPALQPHQLLAASADEPSKRYRPDAALPVFPTIRLKCNPRVPESTWIVPPRPIDELPVKVERVTEYVLPPLPAR